jgi:putative ATP-dependent DNA ligase
MTPDELREALRSHKAKREHYGETEYLRLSDNVRDARRGAVFLDGVMIPGYPSIGRILSLRTGLQEQFEAPFWIEEKIDGYNVRIFRHNGEALALTRGGFICPFTTDRLPDLIDLRILDEHPDLVVCAEIAGPDNPYMVGAPPFVEEDVRLYVFDLMRLGTPGFLPYREKTALIEAYALPAVTCFGRRTREEWTDVAELLRRLNEGGREGVVFKEDDERQRRSKFVTGNSSIADIEATAHNLLQLPPEYFTQRILRLVLFMEEEGIDRDAALERALGRAFLNGLFAAVEQFKHERRVYSTHRCRLRRPENAERLLKLMRRGSGRIKIIQRRLEREGDYYVLEFDKVYPRMTGLFGHLLQGGLVFD